MQKILTLIWAIIMISMVAGAIALLLREKKTRVRCVELVDGFTYGKTYVMLGTAGDYIQVIDNDGQVVTIVDYGFEIIK